MLLLLFTVKVGIPEFLTGVGKGAEKHVEKIESEVGDLQKLLVTRTLKLKKLGIPCKEVIRLNFFEYSSFCIFLVCNEKAFVLVKCEINPDRSGL